MFQKESEDTRESVIGKKGRYWGCLLSQGAPETGSPGVGRTQNSVCFLAPLPSVTTIIIMTTVIKSVITAANIYWMLSMYLALC